MFAKFNVKTVLARILWPCAHHWRLRLSTSAKVGSSADGDGIFDLAVIGGGSGGLACAKEAADLGARVCVFDYVTPSPTRGTAWGLGGTCVNVGCIPKKLMHLAAVHGEALRDAQAYGWRAASGGSGDEAWKHDWSALTDAIRQHVKSLNFGHRSQLMQRNVQYYNMLARFDDCRVGNPHTLTATNPTRGGGPRTVRAANVVIAVGGRPTLPPGVPGAAELGITSDDLFWLPRPPGRTLVIGGGYVALECAGFLAGLGHPAEVMVRTKVCLRGFDRQMASMVTGFMRDHCGVGFRVDCKPVRLEKADGDSVRVHWRHGDSADSGLYNTVIFATGRHPATAALNLPAAGVPTDALGRVFGGVDGEAERTAVPGVYAIGDTLKNGIELTPVAIRAGKLLAKRLFGDPARMPQSKASLMMNYERVATTVFTPLEYACVGLSEEAALTRWGAPGAVEIYHAVHTPYEFLLPHRDQSQCWIKAVCGPPINGNSSSDSNRPLVGLHVTGPNAGEILQGFAALMLRGATTLADLTDTVGIHPTSAEEVTKLWITKSSGVSPLVTGC